MPDRILSDTAEGEAATLVTAGDLEIRKLERSTGDLARINPDRMSPKVT